MNCGDCILGTARRRVAAFLKSGGKRLYMPGPNGFHVMTIEGATASGELRLHDEHGHTFELSVCSIPLVAFAGVS